MASTTTQALTPVRVGPGASAPGGGISASAPKHPWSSPHDLGHPKPSPVPSPRTRRRKGASPGEVLTHSPEPASACSPLGLAELIFASFLSRFFASF